MQLAQESEKDGLQKVPILRATREQAAQPKLFALSFVDVNHGEIALAAGGDVEAQTEVDS